VVQNQWKFMVNRELHEGRFRIIWDGLGYFRLFDVPIVPASILALHSAAAPTEAVMTCAIYTRVSTADQNAELQLWELREHAARQRSARWRFTRT
jgi:hypothetical protein